MRLRTANNRRRRREQRDDELERVLTMTLAMTVYAAMDEVMERITSHLVGSVRAYQEAFLTPSSAEPRP